MGRSLYAHLARRYRSAESVETRAERTERAIEDAHRFYPLELSDQPQVAGDRARPGYRVAVIGGGFAGLAAAWWLSRHGFDVELFEASADIGGRVRSVIDSANQRVAEHGAELNPFRPWDAPRAKEWDEKSVEQWIDGLHGATPLAKRVLRFQLENMQAIPVDQQSYLGLLAPVSSGLGATRDPRREPSAYWNDSEVFRCAVGNQTLGRALAAEIGDERVHCSSRVDRIELLENGATIVMSGMKKQVDWVVLAAPPTSWPACDALPSEWRVKLGAAAKYEMVVEERFWLKDGLAPNGSSDSIGLLWEGTDNQNLPPQTRAQLTLFLGGRPAEQASGSPDPKAFCNAGLAELYRGLAANLTSSVFVNWPAEQHIEGGYSCPRVRQVCSVVKSLHDGVGRILFAGEHTSMPFFGYMEGALQSGVRAAHKIAANAGIQEAVRLANVRREDSRRQVSLRSRRSE